RPPEQPSPHTRRPQNNPHHTRDAPPEQPSPHIGRPQAAFNRQTDRPTDVGKLSGCIRHTDRQIDRQTDRQTAEFSALLGSISPEWPQVFRRESEPRGQSHAVVTWSATAPLRWTCLTPTQPEVDTAEGQTAQDGDSSHKPQGHRVGALAADCLFLIGMTLTILTDIIHFGIYYPAIESLGASDTFRFSAGMAILSLILKPLSCFFVYQMYRERGGDYNINFGFPTVTRNRDAYQSIDQQDQSSAAKPFNQAEDQKPAVRAY
uniref:Angiotensin II receptor-associated protein n=1 Tax=Pygocentrus nattereri TaxID=42514 RepID=A0AAR2IP47_PYGNA